MSATAGTNGAPKKVVPVVTAAPPKPAGKPPPPSKPKKDETIALAAGVVVAGGIAWSLYKSFQGKKEEPELRADGVSGSGQPADGEPNGSSGSAPRSLSSSKSYKFKSTKIYEIGKGDTLWSLAGQFNTSVEALKSLNGLTSDSLVAGETITVPK